MSRRLGDRQRAQATGHAREAAPTTPISLQTPTMPKTRPHKWDQDREASHGLQCFTDGTCIRLCVVQATNFPGSPCMSAVAQCWLLFNEPLRADFLCGVIDLAFASYPGRPSPPPSSVALRRTHSFTQITLNNSHTPCLHLHSTSPSSDSSTRHR